MKVKALVGFLVVSLVVLGSCASSQPVQKAASARADVQILDMYDVGSICMIKNDLLHIYSYSNTEGWQKYPGENLQLPKGYSDVFYLVEMIIGVNINHEVRFYLIDDGQMIELEGGELPGLPEGSWTLPSGHKEVVGLGGVMGIVTGNKLEFYEGRYKIEEIPALTLPEEYGKIFWAPIGGDAIGIVVDGEVRFYDFDPDEGFPEKSELRLKLPAGYTDVTCFDEQYIGVYVDNVLRFFEYAGFWRGIPNVSLEALM